MVYLDTAPFATVLVTDLQHQRLRQMSSTAALKKQADLHKIETDELYCQMIGPRDLAVQNHLLPITERLS